MSSDTQTKSRRLNKPESLIQRDELTVDVVRHYLSYDPDTGIFRWAIPRHKVRVGAVAGTSQRGYCMIHLLGMDYHAHRLAWLYMTGQWPNGDIDHENLDRFDNRWANLRDATKSQNLANIGLPKHNTSGFKGVSFLKKTGKWMAYIKVNQARRYLGIFDDAQDAADAYDRAAMAAFGDFARTNAMIRAEAA